MFTIRHFFCFFMCSSWVSNESEGVDDMGALPVFKLCKHCAEPGFWASVALKVAGLEFTFFSHPYRAPHPSKGPRWGKLTGPWASVQPLLLLPLCLHRTAFMMKWKISGQRRRQNGRRMRSWNGKRSCYSKVSTETSDVLMKNLHEAWSRLKKGSLGFTEVMSHMARLPNGRCLEFARKWQEGVFYEVQPPEIPTPSNTHWFQVWPSWAGISFGTSVRMWICYLITGDSEVPGKKFLN